jgi:hypothetical protein
MAQQTNNQTANRPDVLRSGLAGDTGLLEALFPDSDSRPTKRWLRKMRTRRLIPGYRFVSEFDAVLKKRLHHRYYMQGYRRHPEYLQSDRAYNVVEYLVRCLRAGWEPAECILRLVGVASIADFKRRFESATGRTLDLDSYGVTWFFAHKKPIRNFDFSDPEQFRKCVSVENLTRGEIAKPWRRLCKRPENETPLLPGM